MTKKWGTMGLVVGAVALIAAGLHAAGAAKPASATAKAAAAKVEAKAAVTPVAVAVAAAPSGNADEAFDFFLKEAEVVTASRRAQKKSDSPVAIDVITREEIEQSGALNIWDLLRFRVGVDVIEGNSIEGNPVQINVRGLPEEFNQSLQVLIDGRSIVSSLNSGVFWRDLPVSLEDIERIEIVRGPNSALFGANAGSGVINIITKKPDGASGGLTAEYGQFQHAKNSMSFGVGGDKVKGRLSFSQRSVGTFPSPTGDTSEDLTSQKNERFNGRFDLNLWEDGEVELFAGGVNLSFQQPDALGVGSGNYHEVYLMAQLHQRLGDNSFDLTAARKNNATEYGQAIAKELIDDVDGIFHLNLLDGRSATAFGASFRQARADSHFLFNASNSRATNEVENRMKRAYVSESLSATDWLTLVAALSYEGSDNGGEVPAYQAAVILKPAEGHTLRVSGSKSPTMPSLQNKYADIIIAVGGGFPSGPPPGPIVIPALFVRGADLEPSQVASYEATWSSSFMDRKLTAEITGFQMEIAGQPQIDSSSTVTEYVNAFYSAPWAYVYAGYPYPYANSFNIVLRGTETVLSYKPMLGTTLQLNHTYEDQYVDKADVTRDYITPWNKVNFLASSELPYGFTASTRIGWVGKHRVWIGSRFNGTWIEDQAKVDVRLGYKPTKNLEIYAAGLNLDHAFRTENVDGATQPQMYMGGVNLLWGN